jgi:hypothetical protein
MHHERSVIQGDPKRPDPRLRSYHIYKCNVCKHTQDFNNQPNFQHRLRPCPNCGVTDDTNDKEYLLRQQQALEQEVSLLTTTLDQKRKALTEVLNRLRMLENIQGGSQNGIPIPSINRS